MLNLNNFHTIYHEAGEREVRAIVLYANANKLYVDSEHQTEVTHDEAVEMCKKGFLRVFDTDTFYAVSSFKDSDGTLTINYGTSKTATVTDPLL